MKALPVNQVMCGDAFQVLKEFPNESVDLVMFSPPYWGLRDYGVDGQMGLELHPNLWIQKMVRLCQMLRRVLKGQGSLYLNVGDTYFSSISHSDWSWKGHDGEKWKWGNKGEDKFNVKRPTSDGKWLQPKQLLLMPSRLAIALQEDGWILRNDIVWHKPNHMPSSVKDRLTNSWEHIFHFVQARRYFYDLDSIRKPHKLSSKIRAKHPENKPVKTIASKDFKQSSMSQKQGGWNEFLSEKGIILNPLGKNPSDTITTKYEVEKHPEIYGEDKDNRGRVYDFFNKYGGSTHPLGKNPSDFWRVNTQPFKGAHFAVYPEKLCRMPIKSSCPKDGIVLDPMCGSGTTLVVAHKLGRRWVGIELNKDYVELAKKRLESVGAYSTKLEEYELCVGEEP